MNNACQLHTSVQEQHDTLFGSRPVAGGPYPEDGLSSDVFDGPSGNTLQLLVLNRSLLVTLLVTSSSLSSLRENFSDLGFRPRCLPFFIDANHAEIGQPATPEPGPTYLDSASHCCFSSLASCHSSGCRHLVTG
ncbi:unnamed protein product [Protopolystoma xenopodis]|uniref:Uncharacterized protein n=1 Tax=Protopolystoma xenopodis TaxID=117903 RepID=A0A3S5BUM8_9PLAT|nr:unnamed protein product [Protopolystoma xenopodis]